MRVEVVFFIKSEKSHLSLTALQSRLHSVCIAEPLSQKTDAIGSAYCVLYDCILFTVPTSSERSGLSYFIADLRKVLPGGADQTANWPNWKHLQPIRVMERVTKALSHRKKKRKSICRLQYTHTKRKDIKQEKG